MEERLTLRYSGRDADHHQMGYYDAASVILAFGDLVGIVSRAAYGEGIKLKTSVGAPNDGCITFDFFIAASGLAATVLSGPSTPEQLWTVLRQSIDLWKFLGGKEPTSRVDIDGENVEVTNVHGDIQTFNRNTVIVVGDPDAGRAAERVFNNPLREAASSVQVLATSAREACRVDEEEAGSFVDVSRGNVLSDQIVPITVLIETVVFTEGNKWRLSDGTQRFSATIEDGEFLQKVDSGEKFAKGDALSVDCRIVQEVIKGKLRTIRSIVKVKDHISVQDQKDWVGGRD